MALHHKLCHVVGGSFNLPHAETHTVILPHAVAYNEAAAPAGDGADRRIVGARGASTALHELCQAGRRADYRLRSLGMNEADLDRAADLAIANPYWNPRPLERAAIRQLLRDLIANAWAGRAPAEHASDQG